MENYQELYEQAKKDCEAVRVVNDELSKMAYTINRWSVLNEQPITQPSSKMRQYCQNFKNIYIYGAGAKAERAVKDLDDLDFRCFVVTDGREKADSKLDHPVHYLSEEKDNLQADDSILVVALNPKNTKDALPQIVACAVNEIYFME